MDGYDRIFQEISITKELSLFSFLKFPLFFIEFSVKFLIFLPRFEDKSQIVPKLYVIGKKILWMVIRRFRCSIQFCTISSSWICSCWFIRCQGNHFFSTCQNMSQISIWISFDSEFFSLLIIFPAIFIVFFVFFIRDLGIIKNEFRFVQSSRFIRYGR